MPFIRHYKLTARDDAVDAMADALNGLEQALRPVPGCADIALLRDADGGGTFVFIEYWDSREAHAAGSSQVPAGVMGAIKAAAGAAPEALSLIKG